MERIFSKMKIFLLKKIVFPVLQLIAKHKQTKLIERKLSDKEKTTIINQKFKEFANTLNTKAIKVGEDRNLPPKQYGEYLQQTGKQIWVKKLK